MLFTVVIIVIIVPPDIMNLNFHLLFSFWEYMTEQHEKMQANNPNHDYVIFYILIPNCRII